MLYDTQNPETRETGFFGGTINDIINDLEDGIAPNANSYVMGRILDLLGWGDINSPSDYKALKNMDSKLDILLENVLIIEAGLGRLLREMEINDREIFANTNDPKRYITEISAYFSRLKEKLKENSLGEANKEELTGFAVMIRDNLRIKTDINGIYGAIVPPDIAVTPVLNNYTELLNDRYNQGNGRLTDAYKSLELYTSQLIHHQLKGIELILESENLPIQPYSICPSTGESLSPHAQESLDDFKLKLKEEIDNPGQRNCFMYNTFRLALLNAWLWPGDGKSFFSGEINQFLNRAEFFRTQVLNDNFGLHVLLFATSDITVDKKNFKAKYKDSEITLHVELISGEGIPGRSYDFRENGYHLKSCDSYDVYRITANSEINPGTYDIIYGDNDTILSDVTVDLYNNKYEKTNHGTILYGCCSVLMRSDVNRFPESSKHFSLFHDNQKCTRISKGEANYWPIDLQGTIDGNNEKSDAEYSGRAELRAGFRFSGEKKERIHVDYSVLFTIDLKASSGTGESMAKYHVRVWDITEEKQAGAFNSEHAFNTNNGEKYYSRSSTNTISFTAEPGHHYRICFYMNVKGNGSAGSTISLENVRHIRIRFD